MAGGNVPPEGGIKGVRRLWVADHRSERASKTTLLLFLWQFDFFSRHYLGSAEKSI